MPRAWSLTLVLLLLLPLSPYGPDANAATVDTVSKIPVPPPANGDAGVVGASAVYYGGVTYLFGGRLTNGSYSDRIYKHDPNTGVTTDIASFPPETGASEAGRQSGSAVALGDTIYYFGGAVIVCVPLQPPPAECSKVPKSSRSIVAFKPATATSSVVAQLPVGLWGTEAIAAGGKAYLFGGFTFDVTNPNDIARRDWIIRFDPQGTLGPTATKLDTRLPFAEQDGGAAIVGESAYILGGLGNNDNVTNPCPHNYRYNTTTGAKDDVGPATVCASDAIVGLTISQSGDVFNRGVVAHLPYRSQFVTAAAVNRKIYVPGARLQNGDASDKIIEFNPGLLQNNIRVLFPTLPSAFFAAPSSTDGAKIWLFGGRAADLTKMHNNVTEIVPGATVAWAPRAFLARPGSGQVTLTWQAPSYDGDSPVTGYRIYRTPEGAAEMFIADATSLTYTDTTARPGQQYEYRITTVNGKGESVQSATASTLSGAVPPSAVGSFSASEGDMLVLLTWTTPPDDGGSNITGYRIYVNETAHPAAQVNANTHEFAIRDLTNGVPYSFMVSAVNSKGEGDASATLHATPKAVPPPPTQVSAQADSTNNVTVVWTPPPVTVKGFVVLRGTSPTALTTLTTTTPSTTKFVDMQAQPGRTYYYAVASTNDIGAGVRSEISRVSLVTKPSPPQALFAAPLEGAIRVTWQGPSDPGGLDATTLTYTLVRDGQRIATDIVGTSYMDRPLLPGQPHTYSVIVSNGIESDPSDPVTGTARAIENKAPIATIAILTSVVRANDTVIFDASQSADPDGSIVEYAFDFGDGSGVMRTPIPNATHVYAANGTYTASVLVKDNRGALSSPARGSVIVGDPETKTPGTDDGQPTVPKGTQPGGTPKKVPAPALGILLVGAAMVALLARRRR